MKKIISFSFWGDKPQYVNGAIWNAEHAKDFYPEWTCRFYHDDSIPADALARITATGAEMVLMKRTDDVLGMYWRFAPLDDKDIERFIVRDIDSKFTKREVDMVNEWIKSDKDFHIIRDNRSHNVSMLGGTWGAKAGVVKDYDQRLGFWFSQLTPTDNPRGLFFGTDQMFLHCYIWPIALHNHLAHVRAGEPGLKMLGNEIEVPDPVDGHFVGMAA